ncbi:nucleoside 2-deoxyribosyltransferase [Patescibacteria group bacterium]|nr:nucleoside 2-deoxyribosyltransferase [Patescibacteria group bacterium]
MKIYFAGAIRGGRNDVDLYIKLINYLKKYGGVLTEHIGERNLTQKGEKDKTEEFIHNRDMNWLLEADVMVAEVTTPSLGVGYEIGRAVMDKKKVLCLYREQKGTRLSAMVRGCKDVKTKDYESYEEAVKYIDEFLKQII